MVKLLIDGMEVDVEEGATVLKTCLDAGIYVPHLCAVEGEEHPQASCRLCLVEIEGVPQPVPSCAVKVKEGMAVKTDTAGVMRLQRSALQLLLSAHDVDCKNCPANKKCPLQKAASFLKIGLKPRRLEQVLKKEGLQIFGQILEYHPNRCVLCGRCLGACAKSQGHPFLTFAKRGFDTAVAFFGGEGDIPCADCLSCVSACPVAALRVSS